MKIKRLIIENFRRYRQRTEIPFSDLTAFIGKNDVGKSTILEALDIFFENSKPDPGDATMGGDARQVRIGVVFRDLPDEVDLDSGARSTLAAEHLLNPDGDLEIHKVFNLAVQKPGVPKVFAVGLHPSLDGAANLIQRNNTQLKKIVSDMGLEANCNRNENPSMRQAIYAALGELELQVREVALNEDNGKAIWAALQKYLPIYSLFKSDRPSNDQDPEVQNPMKVAIQKALSELEAELREITAKVEERAKETADRTLEQLQGSYPDLAKTLTPSFRKPSWQNIFKLDLETDDGIPLNKRGSGVRRLVLLSFFQAEAERLRAERVASGDGGVTVVYAIEEPETSQHPDNQGQIIEALSQLSAAGEQVILTTHVPALAGLVPVESLRFVEIDEATGSIRVRSGTPEVYGEVAETLGVLPDAVERPGAQVAVLVEGKTDVDALVSFAEVLSDAGEIPALDQTRVFWALGGGQTLKDWVEREYLDNLGLPQVHLFDSDRTSMALPANREKQDRLAEVNAKPNCKAFMTLKREIENYLHEDALTRASEGQIALPAGTDLDFSDIPTIFGDALSTARQNPGFAFHPDDHYGLHIPVRKRNSKKIITAYILRQMTADEIKGRCEYVDDSDGAVRYEVMDWLSAIQDHLN